MTEDKLMRMIAIQREYKELYGGWNSGLIGISSDTIQLNLKSFQDYFLNNDEYEVSVELLKGDGGKWIEYSTTKEGVKFIAVELIGGQK